MCLESLNKLTNKNIAISKGQRHINNLETIISIILCNNIKVYPPILTDVYIL